jgi:rSAM/selenodomain-associated transferase 2
VKLSVVVPMLNEEHAISTALHALRVGAPSAEIICVDGGSTDTTIAVARLLCDSLISASRGRAHQMNAGTAISHGDVLAFVHADTIVPRDFARQIEAALGDTSVVGGRFDIKLADPALAYRLLGWLISTRSRLMRSATGDQAIFVRREIFEQLGGFADIELCEDIDFVRRMRPTGHIACIRASVTTSARRWQQRGLFRTILRMWTIKSLFLLGVSPVWLKRHYLEVR